MMEIDYNQLDKRFRFYLDAIEIIKQDKIHSSGLINDYYLTDRLQIVNEIRSFAKNNPDEKEIYLTPLLKRYNLIQELIIENFGDSIYNFHSENMGIQPKYDGSEKMNLLGKIIHDTDFIIEHLNELLKPEIQEQPEPPKQKGNSDVIEKILILYYLRFEPIMNNRLTLSQKEIILSRLFEIKEGSIKDPLSKLDKYTILKMGKDLTRNSALGLFPILENVKKFFEESRLFETSKVIQTRIDELKAIAGKL